MKYVEVVTDAANEDTVAAVAEQFAAIDFRPGVVGADNSQAMRLLVREERLQETLDMLQRALAEQAGSRIVVIDVVATMPKPPEDPDAGRRATTAAREALYEEVERNARLDANFLLLVALSTVVAAIGLVENAVAVVIGAMVIAPLLGPNLALSLGTALGDLPLVRHAARTLAAGVALAVGLAAAIGWLWPGVVDSPELLARTRVGIDAAVLALASGAAAALSLTTGLPSVLVGVMVAVALLPPAATLGIMLGRGDLAAALGAGLLLAVNVVCVNLASKLVFLAKGVRPRTWLEKRKAGRAMLVYVLGWIVALVVLLAVAYARLPISR